MNASYPVQSDTICHTGMTLFCSSVPFKVEAIEIPNSKSLALSIGHGTGGLSIHGTLDQLKDLFTGIDYAIRSVDPDWLAYAKEQSAHADDDQAIITPEDL